jgi:hypothetical protein
VAQKIEIWLEYQESGSYFLKVARKSEKWLENEKSSLIPATKGDFADSSKQILLLMMLVKMNLSHLNVNCPPKHTV